MKQLSNLDFLKAAKILNVLVDPVASDDTGLGIGQLWFNTTSNFFKGYDGTNKFSLLRDDLAATITGVLTFNPSSGTVPFAVNGTHTSVVTNLNADRVDGYHAAEAATASTLGARDASGNLTVATPTSDGHAATKAYVDSIAAGQDWKDSCRVATTANITLSGTQTIDGVAVVADDRVLVKDQTTASQNGIYVCAAGAWSRASDADADAEVTSGLTTFVEEGTLNSGAGYTLTTSGAIVVGTTSLTFTKTSGGSVYGAGNGVVKSGTTFHFGQSASYTVGALPYASGASTIGFISAVASGKVLKSNGENTVPLWASLDLTADVGSSILHVANGGTGTSTQFTSGSVVLAGASGVYTEDNAGISFDTSTDRLTVGLITISNIPDSGTGNEVVVSESGALKTQTINAGAWTGDTIWTSGNDGPSSGLNADLLDGQEGSYYTTASNIGGLGANRLLLSTSGGAITSSSSFTYSGSRVGLGGAISTVAGLQVFSVNDPVDVNSSTYEIGIVARARECYDIATGVTDSGYRMGMNVAAHVTDADFDGTLASQYGIYLQHGIYSNAQAGATITNSYGVFIDSYTLAGTTITNLWGLYQANSAAKNYFAGNVGIGSATSPSCALDILQTSDVVTGGTTPVAIRIGATNQDAGANTWNTAADFVQLQLHSSDASGEGAGNRWTVGVSMGDAAGSYSKFNIRDISGTSRLTIDSLNGNVGIGTTDIESWGAGYKALEFYRSSLMWATGSEYTAWSSNAYFDGAWKYKSEERASQIIQNDGSIDLRVAVSDAEDGAISWIAGLLLHNTGNISINHGTSYCPLSVRSFSNESSEILAAFQEATPGGGVKIGLASGAGYLQGDKTGGAVGFYIGANEASYFNGGNLGIGESIPTARLHVYAAEGVVSKFYGGNTDGVRLSTFVADSAGYAAIYAYDDNDGVTPGYATLRLGNNAGLGVYIDGVTGYMTINALATGTGDSILTEESGVIKKRTANNVIWDGDADLLGGQAGSYYLDLANSTGDTDDISEGLTNLFYTDARARAALSSEASAEIAYNNTSGVIGLGTEAGRVKSSTIGDGASTSLTFSHNLGTRDVIVQVFRTGTPYDTILVDVARNTTNQVTIGPFTTAPTSGEFTVVCTAANG